MNGADKMGALGFLNSVAAALPRRQPGRDFQHLYHRPRRLGKNMEERVTNLTNIMDGYFGRRLPSQCERLGSGSRSSMPWSIRRSTNLTIRVSGYAVRFNRLKRQHQLDVINRTFHEAV